MKRVEFRKVGISVAVAGALSAGFSQAHASGFALIEQNASGLGNAYAGAAAVAEDASTIYYNPAGLSLLQGGKQFVFGGNLISPSMKFNNNGSLPSGTGIPLPTAVRPLGGSGGDAGDLAAVPHFYYAMDVAKDWKIGIGVGAPFGLKTEYAGDWLGRFQGLLSDIKTINVNPTVAYKVNDKVSLGFGLNWQKAELELTQAVNYVAGTFGGLLQAGVPAATAGAIAGAIPAANAEGSAQIKVKDDSWGYNLGAMFALTPQTRLGVTYRSSIKYSATGTVNYSGVPAGLPAAVGARVASGNVSTEIKTPDTISLALNSQLDQKWTLLGDITWTGWAKIQELKVVRDTGATLSTLPFNYRNTLRVGVGAIYRYNEQWSSKVGLAYDQTPTNDTDRSVRLPDGDRTWLSIGLQYRPSKDITLDVGYTHLFIKDTSVYQNGGSTAVYGLVSGNYKNSTDILGAQAVVRF